MTLHEFLAAYLRYIDMDATTGCWNWMGTRNSDGYGLISKVQAHIVAWEAMHPDQPRGKLLLCHSCDNSRCCSPLHLRLGTPQDNVHDAVLRGRHVAGISHGAVGRRDGATHCIHGHEFTPENTYYSPTINKRECRECKRVQSRERNARKQARRVAER